MLASTGKEEGEGSVAAEELGQGSSAHSMHSDGVDSITSSPVTAAAVATSAASNVNLISEGMTAEEAAATRNNRLHQTAENKVDDNNNNSSMMSNIAMTITEGMTAEDAQKARMARSHSSTLSSFDTATTPTTSIKDKDDSTINTPPSTIPQNNRGVSDYDKLHP
eukprot:scaffold6807_cov78-Skeletonema_marinoi.AAC.3